MDKNFRHVFRRPSLPLRNFCLRAGGFGAWPKTLYKYMYEAQRDQTWYFGGPGVEFCIPWFKQHRFEFLDLQLKISFADFVFLNSWLWIVGIAQHSSKKLLSHETLLLNLVSWALAFQLVLGFQIRIPECQILEEEIWFWNNWFGFLGLRHHGSIWQPFQFGQNLDMEWIRAEAWKDRVCLFECEVLESLVRNLGFGILDLEIWVWFQRFAFWMWMHFWNLDFKS